jgi:hypothetical protein
LTGKEILLFDPRRNPRDWVEVLGPTQCAVLLKDRASSVAVALTGRPCRGADATRIVFDTLDAAEAFCETNGWKRTADGSAAKAEGKDPRPRLTPQVRTYLRSNT